MMNEAMVEKRGVCPIPASPMVHMPRIVVDPNIPNGEVHIISWHRNHAGEIVPEKLIVTGVSTGT